MLSPLLLSASACTLLSAPSAFGMAVSTWKSNRNSRRSEDFDETSAMSVSLLSEGESVISSDGEASLTRSSLTSRQRLHEKANALRQMVKCAKGFMLRNSSSASATLALAADGHTEQPLITSTSTKLPNMPPNTSPRFPFEPLLDDDYILDSDNYLEDYINGAEATITSTTRTTVPSSTSEKATTTLPAATTTASAITTETTITPITSTTTKRTTTQKTALTTTTTTINPSTSTAATTTTTTASRAVAFAAADVAPITFAGCVTRADPRLEHRFQSLFKVKPAPHGTSCVFGIDERDEGKHCILDGGRFGLDGWCYTTTDRTEWGSCSKGCPLQSGADQVGARIDRLTLKVKAALAKLGVEELCDYEGPI
mmetsp:Transcript_26898/g.52689  ORF Transcript_26898/g.52689 Transcript_26898/m.52689 type:complete len:370 (+) Transcript_26898:95-1204(+)